MPRRLLIVGLMVLALANLSEAKQPLVRPNIVVMLADDMGFGELHCLNPERGKIATP